MKNTIIILTLIIVLLLSACSKQAVQNESRVATEKAVTTALTEQRETKQEQANTMTITVNGTDFEAELYDNESAKALQKMLPLTLDMQELHGNEKYHYFDTSLPYDERIVSHINEGDIMLYGDNCLVLFYKSISTSYRYTKIGHITDTEGLAEALGSDNVTVTFE